MTTLWKALQQDNITMRVKLGSGDPSLTSLLGTFSPGEAADTMFASSLIGASRDVRSIKDKIARANSYSQDTAASRRPGRDGRPTPGRPMPNV